MQEHIIHEVQIKGVHPYPCFANEEIAHHLSRKNGNANVVTRKFNLFTSISDYDVFNSKQRLNEILSKLTDEERVILKKHFTQS